MDCADCSIFCQSTEKRLWFSRKRKVLTPGYS
jgi:hypothetical protein